MCMSFEVSLSPIIENFLFVISPLLEVFHSSQTGIEKTYNFLIVE